MMGLGEDWEIALDVIVAAVRASLHSVSKGMMCQKGDLRKAWTKDFGTFF